MSGDRKSHAAHHRRDRGYLDFHIFDVLGFDVLLGSPMKKLLDISLGSLDHKVREFASTASITGSGPLLVKPLPNQDPLKKMMHVSLFASPELVLIEVVDFSTLRRLTRKILFTYVKANDHHPSRPNLSLFPLARMMLLSIMIESQY
jgi:hypothetical protein